MISLGTRERYPGPRLCLELLELGLEYSTRMRVWARASEAAGLGIWFDVWGSNGLGLVGHLINPLRRKPESAQVMGPEHLLWDPGSTC